MAADLFTASGATIAIGPAAVATVDTSAEFAALTPYNAISNVESIGEYGDEAGIVSGAVLGDARVRKAKSARDAGSLTITVFPDQADLGQAALIAAEASNNVNFAFKITLPNRLTPGGTDEINYLRGLVTSKRRNVGANDNLVRDTYTVTVNSPVVVVAPT
jgi:hypothetical protein